MWHFALLSHHVARCRYNIGALVQQGIFVQQKRRNIQEKAAEGGVNWRVARLPRDARLQQQEREDSDATAARMLYPFPPAAGAGQASTADARAWNCLGV